MFIDNQRRWSISIGMIGGLMNLCTLFLLDLFQVNAFHYNIRFIILS